MLAALIHSPVERLRHQDSAELTTEGEEKIASEVGH
jgi:hypothetical protein